MFSGRANPTSGGLFGGGTNNTATNNAAAPQQQAQKLTPEEKARKYQELRAKIIKERTIEVRAMHSAVELYKMLRTIDSISSPEKCLKELFSSQEIKEKYSKLLLRFGDSNPEQLKDVSKFFEGMKISNVLGAFKLNSKIELMLKQISKSLDLDLLQTFYIMEEVFFESYSYLQQVNSGHGDSIQKSLVLEANIRYYHERGLTIKIISALMISAKRGDAIGSTCREFLIELLKNGLMENLWKSYKSISESKPSKAVSEKKQLYYSQLLSEQNSIIQTLYKGFLEGWFKITPEIFTDILRTLKKQEFSGSYRGCIAELGIQGEENYIHAESIGYYSFLMITSALNLTPLIRGDLHSFFDSTSAPMNLFENQIPEIVEFVRSVSESDDRIRTKGGYLLRLVEQLFDASYAVIMSGEEHKSEKLSHISLLLKSNTEAFIELSDASDYMISLEDLLRSHFFETLNSSEKDDVRHGIKTIISMPILHLDDSTNPLARVTPEELEFIGRVICDCLKNEDELQEFWTSDDSPFSRLLGTLFESFPLAEEVTAKLLKAYCGNLNTNRCRNVVQDLCNMEQFLIIEPKDNLRTRKIEDNEDVIHYILEADHTTSNGIVLPKGSRALFKHNSGISAITVMHNYNYFAVIWREWNVIIQEGMQRSANIDLRHSRFMKLICKIVELIPTDADVILEKLLDIDADKSNYFKGENTIIAPLLFTFLDTLTLLKNRQEEVSLALAILKAYNALILSRFGSQALLALQIYQFTRMGCEEDGEIHPIIELVQIFDVIQQEKEAEDLRMGKPTKLILEVVKLLENILVMSDYIYDHICSINYYHKQKMSDLKQSEDDISDFMRAYDRMVPRDINSLHQMGESFGLLLERSTEGKMFAKSSFFEDAMRYVVEDFFGKFQRDVIKNYIECSELNFEIASKLVSIINNLVSRFKVSSGKKLIINDSKVGEFALDELAKFINDLHLKEFILEQFEVKLNTGVFFGEKQPQGESNSLGIENKLWIKENNSKTLHKTKAYLEKFFIEMLSLLNTIIELIDQRNTLILSGRSATKLNLVGEMAPLLCDPERLYTYPMKSPDSEYGINIFLAITLMSDYSHQKGFPSLPQFNPDFYFYQYVCPSQDVYIISSRVDMMNFLTETYFPGMVSSGRYTPLHSSQSISQSCFETMGSLLRLWGKRNGSYRRPIIGDVLIGNGVSNTFASNINTFIYSNIIFMLERAHIKPFEAAAALEIVVESYKSQRPFFEGFIKYSASLRDRTPRLSEFIIILEKIVNSYRSCDSMQILSSSSAVRLVCAITEITSLVILKDDGFYELIEQLRKFVLEPLSALICKLLSTRRDPLEQVVLFAREVLYYDSKEFALLENTISGDSIKLIRIRDMAEQEVRLTHSASLLMQLARHELYTRTVASLKDEATIQDTPPLFGPEILTLMDSLLSKTIVHTENMLYSIEMNQFKYLLTAYEDDFSMLEEGRDHYSREGLVFEDYEEFSQSTTDTTQFNERLGIIFDEFSTLRNLKELNFNAKKTNTILYCLSYYNCLSKIKDSRIGLISEIEKNIALASSLGFNGVFFTTISSQDPFSNIVRFVASIEHQQQDKLNWFKTMPENEQIYATQSTVFDGVTIPRALKEFLCQFPTPGHKISALSIFNKSDKPLNSRVFPESIEMLEASINNCRSIMEEVYESFQEEIKQQDFSLIPYKILKNVVSIANIHFRTLSFLITNLYYLKKSDYVDHAKKIYVTLIDFLAVLNPFFSYLERCKHSAGEDLSEFFFCLFSASSCITHFKDIVGNLGGARFASLQWIVSFLEKYTLKGKKDQPHFGIAMYCLLMFVDIRPSLLSKEYIERYIRMLGADDLAEDEYIAICQFLIACFDCPERRKKITETNILDALLNLSRFANESFSEIIFYERDKRNPKQISWCWTLQLAIVAFKALLNVSLKFNYMMEFLQRHQTRLCSVLCFKQYGVRSEQPSRGDSREISQGLSFRTGAYLEELELTLTLLNIVFKNGASFKKRNYNLFEQYFHCLTTRTLYLFTSENSGPDTFKAVDWLEIHLQKIRLGASENKPQASVPRRNPSVVQQKRTGKKSSYVSEYGGAMRSTNINLSRSYSPDLFTFKIETTYTRVLFMLFNCLVSGVEHSEFYNYIDDATDHSLDISRNYRGYQSMLNQSMSRGDTSGHPLQNKSSSMSYPSDFWKKFSSVLGEAQEFAFSSYYRLLGNEDTVKDGLVQLLAFNNAPEVTCQYYALNTLYSDLKSTELQDISYAGFEMSLYIQNVLFQHFDAVNEAKNPLMVESMMRDKHRAAKLLEELTWSSKGVTNYKQSMLKMSVASNIDLSPIEEEDSQDKYFIEFMKKYYK